MKKYQLISCLLVILILSVFALFNLDKKATAHAPTNTHQQQSYGWHHTSEVRGNSCFQVRVNIKNGLTGNPVTQTVSIYVTETSATSNNTLNSAINTGLSTYTTPCLNYTNSSSWFSRVDVFTTSGGGNGHWRSFSYFTHPQYANNTVSDLLWVYDFYVLPLSSPPTTMLNPHRNYDPLESLVSYRTPPETLAVYWYNYEPDAILNWNRQSDFQGASLTEIDQTIWKWEPYTHVVVSNDYTGNWPSGDINLGKYDLADGTYDYDYDVKDSGDNYTPDFFYPGSDGKEPAIGIDRVLPTASCYYQGLEGTFAVTLTESDTFGGSGGMYGSGIGAGDVDVKIGSGSWDNTGLPNGGDTTADFSYNYSGAASNYQFRYRVRDNAADSSGNFNQWSNYVDCQSGPAPSPSPTPPGLPGGGNIGPNSTGACHDKANIYCYRVSQDRRNFILWAQLENKEDPDVYNSTKDTAACNDNDSTVIPPNGGFFNFCIRSPR